MEWYDLIVLWADLALGAAASYFAFRFAWHYRLVDWRATEWGRHIMHFSVIVGFLFGLTVISNLLAMNVWWHFRAGLWLTYVGYAYAVWALHRRNVLEARTREREGTARYER